MNSSSVLVFSLARRDAMAAFGGRQIDGASRASSLTFMTFISFMTFMSTDGRVPATTSH
jgi:hypothetical protein